MSENLERQLDELSAMQAMYSVNVQIDELELEQLRSAASNPDAAALDDLPELMFSIVVPLAEEADASSSSASCELRVAMPTKYPEEERLRASCSTSGATRAFDSRLNAALSQQLEDIGVGSETVMAAAMWLSNAAAEMLAEESAAAAAAASSKDGQAAEVIWSRCTLWAEKLLEGRTHKPAARTLEIATALGLTGRFFYGRPGIIIAEGPQDDVDELVREARRAAGKQLRPKKTQRLSEGAASRQYERMATVSAKPGDSLDAETLQEHLERLGIAHKYKFIIGLEDAA